MKRIIVVSIFVLVMLVALVPVANAEMAKEGTFSFTCIYSGTGTYIPLDKEHLVIAYQNKGALVSDTGKGPFHNMSYFNVGVLYLEKGVGKLLGYITLTDPAGDKVLFEIREEKAQGPPAVNSGTGKCLHGTGKFTGIEGTMEYTRLYVRPATKGSSQSIAKVKGNWKLPLSKD